MKKAGQHLECVLQFVAGKPLACSGGWTARIVTHNGVLAEWWLGSHCFFGGGWAARIVTQWCFS